MKASLQVIFFSLALGIFCLSCNKIRLFGVHENDLKPRPIPKPTIQVSEPSPTPIQASGLTSITTLVGNLHKTVENVPISQTGNEIEFGSTRVFKVGDNRAESSDCKSYLFTFDFIGTKYSFAFEVFEDGTEVAISIKKMCGIDFANTNFLYLLSESEIIDAVPLAVGSSAARLKAQTLPKGKYMILIESQFNKTAANGTGDNDDFIFGNVNISSNKNIAAGFVKTE